MINKINLIKYLILFSVVTLSTFYIPNCSIINEHSVVIGAGVLGRRSSVTQFPESD